MDYSTPGQNVVQSFSFGHTPLFAVILLEGSSEWRELSGVEAHLALHLAKLLIPFLPSQHV